MSGRSGRSSASWCRHGIVAKAWRGRFSMERSLMPRSAAWLSWKRTRWTSRAAPTTIRCGSAQNRCTTPPGSKRWPAESRLGLSSESAPPEAAGNSVYLSGMTPEERPHGQSSPSQAPFDRALLSRRPERHRRRVPVLQFRHGPRAAHRGDGALEERRAALSEGSQLPAREHRDAHGGGLRHGDRARAGGDGARGRGHGEFRDGDAQRAPRAAAARAHGRQGALYCAGRIAGLARQLRALHPGALRPVGDRAPVREVGMDAALGRDDEGDAEARAQRRAQRSHGPGLPDAAARDAHPDLGRGGDARFPGGALRRGALGCGRCGRRRADCRQARFRETPRDGDLLCRAQPRGAGADRGDRARGRNPRFRSGPALSQHLASVAVLCRNDARDRRGRRRAAGRRGRAVDPDAHQGEPADLVGAHRRGRGEGMLPHLGLRLERAPAGRQRPDPQATARGAPRESDARVPRIGDDAIVVNEGIRNGPVVNNQIMRTRAGSSIGFAGGGLGSSSGTALGIKLAKPEATVVQMVGDGGFYFGNPSSVYAVSKQYKLPIFTVLFDNSGWSAVKEATLRVYPEGDAQATNEFNALLAPDIEFTKICEAAGGYGERVEDPEAVPAAIQRCLKEVRGGRSALMHARIPVL